MNQPARADRAGRLRAAAATTALSGVVVAWAALPLRAGDGADATLIAAVVCAVGAAMRLAVPGSSAQHAGLTSWVDRGSERAVAVVRGAAWADLLIVAVLALEAEHPARPWHTGLLGLALLAYVLAVHLTESKAAAAVLRPQLPVLLAGIGLMALSVGAAALPALPAGGASSVLKMVAVVAAVVTAGLAVPAWIGRDR